LGSGLAIGAAATFVVVAGITAYTVVRSPSSDDAVNQAVALLSPQAEEIRTEPAPTPSDSVEKVDTEVSPSFDVVRVDKAGSTVIAGKAAANSDVDILVDGEVVASTQADANGAFVSLLDIEPSNVPRELELSQKEASDAAVISDDKVLVMPFEAKADAAPDLVLAKPESVEIISEPKVAKADPADIDTSESATAVTDVLSLDTIVYDDLGDVVISGRGNSSDFVRIYLDNKPTEVKKIPDSGQWKINLTDVPDGLYALRVDSVDVSGVVTERVQSPFKREAADAVVASTKENATNVTIQPGYTLWALAENKYGDGTRYVQIFDANRDHIKDPDLIYPGQIFDLPG
jgi:hypothetical protein